MIYDFDKIIDRLGTYSTQWDYIEDRFGRKDLLPFSISDTDFEVPSVVIEDLQTCIQHSVFGYTRWNHDDFKMPIVHHFLNRGNTHIEKDWILYSPSVMYSVSVLLRFVSEVNDGVLVFDPMYDAFINVIEKNGRRLLPCALCRDYHFSIDWEDFEHKAKQAKVFLLCSPHNPTGRVFTLEEHKKMISICKAHKVFIISDEIHSDVVLHGSKHVPILHFYQEYDKMALVSSSSKTFNTPALGGSYAMVPNKDLYDSFLLQTRQKDFVNSANIMGMKALMCAYQNAQDYIDQLISYIEGNMKMIEDFMKKEFPMIQFCCPQATYLAWIDVRELPYSSASIQKALVEVGKVGIMAGEVYGENGKGYLRLNAGCPRSKLEEGLERFKKAMLALNEGIIC
ncbi:MalY/PatB family protein [Amedibacillus sp. YH-ame6]